VDRTFRLGGPLAWRLLGMALNLTPCVYPPSSSRPRSSAARRARRQDRAVDVAGICLTFTALGAVAAPAAIFGAALQQLAVLGGSRPDGVLAASNWFTAHAPGRRAVGQLDG
jgi:hypothetical protein